MLIKNKLFIWYLFVGSDSLQWWKGGGVGRVE